jgi:UPF0176 protein
MSQRIVIAALYRFVQLDNFEALRQPLLQVMLDNQVRGTLLLAAEGINGTVAGAGAGVEKLLDFLRQDPRLRDFDCKLCYDAEMPFYRSRVKLKREIVTMGVDGIDPANSGTYVSPADWNRLISDPEVTLIDTRNDYESAIGSFENAVFPNTSSFRDFPAYAAENLDPKKHRKIAGGILKYLEEIPPSESLWHGECFVFDNRVSVNHALEKGSYDQCHACRRPITDAEKASDKYQPGVSCPACYDDKSDAARRRFREREKQVRLARERGEQHIGADAAEQARQRKTRKYAARQAQRGLDPA